MKTALLVASIVVGGALESHAVARATAALAGALTVLALTAAPPASARAAAPGQQALVISVSKQRISLADFVVRGGAAPTYAAAIRAFGPPDLPCKLRKATNGANLPNASRVVWRRLGLTIDFVTYGGFRGGHACSEPGSVYVDGVVITSPRWRTVRGLRVGDPLSKLRRLYPTALPRRGSWQIVVDHSPIGTGGLHPVFAAKTQGGRVSSFLFSIGAARD
jgi:hypothetical protein